MASSNNTTNMGNNVPEGQQAGVLTNPGFLAQYYSNFGFRRQRLIQEVFQCTRFPAEISPTPQIINSALYSAPWPLHSITSNAAPPTYPNPRRVIQGTGTGGGNTIVSSDYVDFNLEQGCYNCHTTLNHRAPLFRFFDATGYMNTSGQSMVHTTVAGAPFVELQDYLPSGQQFSWKYQVPTGDLQSYGAAIAADPQTAKCFMIRLWNEAYSRDDVVIDLALVPDSVIAPLTQYFVANNYNMKMAIAKLYTDANFIRF
jgi:hypothetical protein